MADNSLLDVIVTAGAGAVGGGGFAGLAIKMMINRAVKKFDETIKSVESLSSKVIEHNIHIENLLTEQAQNRSHIVSIAKLEKELEDKAEDINAAFRKIRDLETNFDKMKMNWMELDTKCRIMVQQRNDA